MMVGRLKGAGRGEGRGSTGASLAKRLLLGLGGTASLGPSALEDAAADAASGFEIGSVLVKSLGQVVAAGSGWVAAGAVVVVPVDQVGWIGVSVVFAEAQDE